MDINVVNINSLHTNTTGACGYCQQQQTQNTKWVSSGFECAKMDIHMYNVLINRGWRRSGTYYYKPDIQVCCCKPYPIRVLSKKFNIDIKNNITKSQRKWERYLSNQENEEQLDFITTQDSVSFNINNLQSQENDMEQFKEYYQIELEAKTLFIEILNKIYDKITENDYQEYKSLFGIPQDTVLDFKQLFTKQRINSFNLKDMKQHGYTQKCFVLSSMYGMYSDLFEKTLNISKDDYKDSSVNQFVQNVVNKILESNQDYTQKYQIQIQVISSSINFKFYKYQDLIKEFCFKQHSYSQQSLQLNKEKKERLTKIIPKSKKKYEFKLIPATFDQENVQCQESFNLYKEYMMEIHNKTKISKQSYKNFLCVQALKNEKQVVKIDGELQKEITYGCFHLNCYIDDILMMVSVVDILPQGLSQVYNFYKPSLKKYYIGIISSLNDIRFIKDNNKYFPDFEYYYTGFYIQNNQKMKYKADYQPCQLLCPYSYQWIDLDNRLKNLIDQNNKNPALIDLNQNQQNQICPIIEDMNFNHVNVLEFVKKNIKLFIGGEFIKLDYIKKNYILYFENLLTKLVLILGKQVSQNCIFGDV